MFESLIKEILNTSGPEIKDLSKNSGIVIGFLKLVQKVSVLPNIDRRFYEMRRSLYQATARGINREELENVLKEFFGLPLKEADVGLPLTLRFNPSVRHLKGVEKDQVFFLKQMNIGEFYGALWPWKRDVSKIEIHLGYCSPKISDSDYQKIQLLIDKAISRSALESMNASLGGGIQGIGISSFLQMCHMEEMSCTLKVSTSKKQGYLHLQKGELIGAETGTHKGRQAAYRIISWDNSVIQIISSDASMEDVIQLPLMNILMESLKIKDEKPRSGWEDESDHVSAIASQIGMPEYVMATENQNCVSELDSVDKSITSPPVAEDSEGDLKDQEPHTQTSKRRYIKRSLVADKKVWIPILCFLIFLFCFYLISILNAFRIRQEYAQLVEDVGIIEDLEQKKELFNRYLSKKRKDEHWKKVSDLMKRNDEEIERLAFLSVEKEIQFLTVDESFKQKAKQIFSEFLLRYPDSSYSSKIRAQMDSVDNLYEDVLFQKLINIPNNDLIMQFSFYKQYLSAFKDGKYRTQVNDLLSKLSESYFKLLEAELSYCNANGKWDHCIELCDNYISTFENEKTIPFVLKYKKDLSEKKDYEELEKKMSSDALDDFQTKNILVAYLEKYPESLKKEEISKRLDELSRKIAYKKEWDSIQSYVSDLKNSRKKRMAKLKSYMALDSAGPYLKEANEMMDSLKGEVSQSREIPFSAKGDLVIPDTYHNRSVEKVTPSSRFLDLEAKIQELIRGISRFQSKDDGTFFDSRTGLQWALIDSMQQTKRCMNYSSALKYTKELLLGGNTDWRLPTSEELAALYKSSPPFPNVGTDWYWTSEAFTKGYHNVANIVTSQFENSFIKKTSNQDACGAVRAVRP